MRNLTQLFVLQKEIDHAKSYTTVRFTKREETESIHIRIKKAIKLKGDGNQRRKGGVLREGGLPDLRTRETEGRRWARKENKEGDWERVGKFQRGGENKPRLAAPRLPLL